MSMITKQINSLREAAMVMNGDNNIAKLFREAADTIEQLAAKARPKTGRWIRMKAYEKWGCSECNTVFRFTFKEHDYCPNCGAKMIEPQESEEV